jgi:NADP-dependent 3-hydroxy acid dehydrogenase YdfG
MERINARHAEIERAIDDIRASWPAADLHLQQLDLASLDSVRTATDEMRERYHRIDLLMNNAGAMYTQQDRSTRRNRCGPTPANRRGNWTSRPAITI